VGGGGLAAFSRPLAAELRIWKGREQEGMGGGKGKAGEEDAVPCLVILWHIHKISISALAEWR